MEGIMIELFVKIFNMSISAGILILIVMVWRLALSKAPKWMICLLWGLVAIRLVCPFSFSSPFSVYRFVNPAVIKNGTIEYVSYSNTPEKPRMLIGRPSEAEKIVDAQAEWSMAAEDYADTQNGVAHGAEVQNTDTAFGYNHTADMEASDKDRDKADHITDIYLPPIITAWLLGIFGFFLYAVYSLILLKQRLREAVCDHDNIYLCDAVESPFILGIISPKIYLNSDTKPEQMEYILAHEQSHLKRKDHWWKPLAYLLLAVYWFQPLCWAAYFLFCRDIEMACDERVIRDFDLQAKKEYSDTLLSFCLPKRTDLVYPLAFGEVSVKERVKSVLSYKKPAFWIFIAALAACAVTVVCFMTTPGVEKAEKVNVAEEVKIEDAGEGLGEAESDETGQNEGLTESVNAAREVPDEDVAETFGEVADRYEKNEQQTAEPDSLDGNTEEIVNINDSDEKKMEEAIDKAVIQHNKNRLYQGNFICESHRILAKSGYPGYDDNALCLNIYAVVMCCMYDCTDTKTEEVSGVLGPCVLTFDVSESGEYKLRDYWEPEDGAHYGSSIRDKFPADTVNDAIDAPKYADELSKECDEKAKAYKTMKGNRIPF